jgi:hypothetical protein
MFDTATTSAVKMPGQGIRAMHNLRVAPLAALWHPTRPDLTAMLREEPPYDLRGLEPL